jgi:hypothetical protein
MALWILLSTPVHSNTKPASRPKALLISSATPSGPTSPSTLTVLTLGTNLLAISNRLSSKSVITNGAAPAACAASKLTNPIGPAPQITKGSPNLSPARSIPASATDNGSSIAPSSKDMSSGNLCSQAAGCAW